MATSNAIAAAGMLAIKADAQVRPRAQLVRIPVCRFFLRYAPPA